MIYSRILWASLFCFVLLSCSKLPEQDLLVFEGEMNQTALRHLKGVQDVYKSVIDSFGLTPFAYANLINKKVKTKEDVNLIIEIALKIQNKLLYPLGDKKIPGKLEAKLFPVYEKFIPLSEVEYYLSNRYRDIRGFVTYAGDTRYQNISSSFSRMRLNLNYEGSPFVNAQYAGYAVIRFTSRYDPSFAFSEEFWDLADPKYKDQSILFYNKGLSGYPEPFTGTGLIDGGLRFEFFCEYDLVPLDGEIYEITQSGNEILRGVLTNLGWRSYDGEYVSRAVDLSVPLNNTIKTGLCTLYENDYYTSVSIDGKEIRMFSDSLIAGFDTCYSWDHEIDYYVKDIPINIDDLYYVYTYVAYKGDTFQVRTFDVTRRYHLITSDPIVAKRHNMMNIDYGTWRLLIPENEINVKDFEYDILQ